MRIDQDVWILDTSRPTSMPVTSGPVLEESPVWSGDGRRLVFTTSGGIGTLFEQAVDGPPGPRLLLGTTLQHKQPTSASRDGRFLLFNEVNMGRSGVDVWVLPLKGDGKPFPLIQRASQQDQAQFSPDGRWVAYASSESGRYEVLVQRFIAPSERTSVDPETIVVSTDGGTAPRWRDADGKELYFIAPDGTVMAADVSNKGEQLSIGVPHPLFRLAGSHGDWDVVSDGSRFLIAIPAGADASAPFTVLWNRLAQLPRP